MKPDPELERLFLEADLEEPDGSVVSTLSSPMVEKKLIHRA